MTPSDTLYDSEHGFMLKTERSFTPIDLLNSVLSRLDHNAFGVSKLSVFEDPAIVSMRMTPEAIKDKSVKRFSDKIERLIFDQNTEFLLSIKISRSYESARNFIVHYAVDRKNKPLLRKKSIDTEQMAIFKDLIIDMFNAVPEATVV